MRPTRTGKESINILRGDDSPKIFLHRLEQLHRSIILGRMLEGVPSCAANNSMVASTFVRVGPGDDLVNRQYLSSSVLGSRERRVALAQATCV